MSWQLAALLLLGGSTVLIFLGMPVALSFVAINLVGEVLFLAGLALKVIDGVERLIAQVPGRLAVVAVVAGTVFSAISGSTIATTAMLGSLMLPVMLARGYHPTLATGLMLSAAFVAYIIVRAKLSPSLAPPTPIARQALWESWRLLLIYVLPLVA